MVQHEIETIIESILYKLKGEKFVEKLPSEIKLSRHARKRIEERNKAGYKYNTKNLMKSGCKWYGKDDFIVNSPFYLRYIIFL